MRIIVIILLLLLSCNDPDSPFNPNKNKILAKEKRKCRAATLTLYVSGLNNSKQFIDGDCDDPASLSRKESPDINQFKEKELKDFQLFIAAQFASCPKGLAED